MRKQRKSSKAATRKDRPDTGQRRGAYGVRRWLPAIGAAALLATHAFLARSSITQKCATYDEVAHLTKGYAYWQFEDNRLMPDHPPLAQAWAALPLLDEGLNFPPLDQNAWRHSNIFKLGEQFFYSVDNDPDAMLRQGRTMIIVLSMALGAVVFVWSRRLFGTTGGLVSLALYAFSPTVLANSRLVTTDMAVSLFFMLSVGAVWWVLHRVSPASFLGGIAALSGLFLSKMSAVLIIPMGLVLMVIRLLVSKPVLIQFRREWRLTRRWQMLLVFLVVMLFFVVSVALVIWAAFDFRYDAMVDADPRRDRLFTPRPPPDGKTVWEHMGRSIPKTAAAIEWAREHRVLPEPYLYGFLFTIQSARGRDAFLNGERSLYGWWYFFPCCFLYKVPLPIMGVIFMAGTAIALGRCRLGNSTDVARAPPRPAGTHQRRRITDDQSLLGLIYRTAPLWILLATYWAFAIRSNLNIGHRHLLPTFPPMFVLCGAAAAWLKDGHKWLRAVVPSLLALLVIVAVWTWPHYLAYFNTIAGGPSQGYRHLVQSSLDWGQDLPGLKRWLDGHGGDQKVYVAYHGKGSWRHYGISAFSLPRFLREDGKGDYSLTPGIYCISATKMQQIYLLETSAWNETLEKKYQRLRPEMTAIERVPNDLASRKAFLEDKREGFKDRFNEFQKLRFGRLCAYLRQREPDAHVGYSILIYRLGNEDINLALSGPTRPSTVR